MEIQRLDWSNALGMHPSAPSTLTSIWRRFQIVPTYLRPRETLSIKRDCDSFVYVVGGRVAIDGIGEIEKDTFGRFSRPELRLSAVETTDARLIFIHDRSTPQRTGDDHDISRSTIVPPERPSEEMLSTDQHRLWRYCDMNKGADLRYLDIRDGIATISERYPAFWFVLEGSGRVEHDLASEPVDKDCYGFTDSELPLTLTGCMTVLVMTIER